MWVTEIQGALTVGVVSEFLSIRDLIKDVILQPGVADYHIWRLSSNGQYSAWSAYKNRFQGMSSFRPYTKIWRAWAPGKCKFFLWLVAHDWCWTAERLARRVLPHPDRCPHCDQAEESINHLLLSCVFAREFWFKLLQRVGLQFLAPRIGEELFNDWWERI